MTNPLIKLTEIPVLVQLFYVGLKIFYNKNLSPKFNMEEKKKYRYLDSREDMMQKLIKLE